MRILLDACIIYPTVMREMLMGVAAKSGFIPLWSHQILEEWRHAAARLGPEGEAIATGEIAVMNSQWPQASVQFDPDMVHDLYLPDDNDRHVLAAAIAGEADAIMTRNLKDFPTRILTKHDILRREPDEFMLELARTDECDVAGVAADVQERAVVASGREQPMRALLKRAGLPRLGKYLD